MKDESRPKELSDHMYTVWNLRKPQLILSVTGSTREFTLSSSMKKTFKRGLVKVAESTESWILTNGFNMGVMKLVGEAIAESTNHSKPKLTAIGILSLEIIAFREKFQAHPEKRKRPVGLIGAYNKHS